MPQEINMREIFRIFTNTEKELKNSKMEIFMKESILTVSLMVMGFIFGLMVVFTEAIFAEVYAMGMDSGKNRLIVNKATHMKGSM